MAQSYSRQQLSGADRYHGGDPISSAVRSMDYGCQNTMDNPRLADRSEVFNDDEGVKIVKRCFFLAIGDDDLADNAFILQLGFNVFDEPHIQRDIKVNIKLSNVIIELCPALLKSIT